MANHYETLGIDKNATPEDIKTAYRRMARQWHPDKNTSPEATDQFQKINEAYQVLSDPAKKRQYDAPASSSSEYTFHADNLDELLRKAYKANAEYKKYQDAQQQYTIHHLSLRLEEAYMGGEKTVSGTKIKFPAGTRNGARFNIDNAIYLVRILPHIKFSIVNTNDLMIRADITTLDAIVGTTLKVTHLDGTKLEIEVPPGIQHDQIIRVIGKGMPIPNQQASGHLFIVCSLRTPTDLTQDQKTAILKAHPKRTQEI